jgi:4-hydroxythreonine-4-phosphate dehydrogenase
MPKPLIALTMGDPCGVGPEIIVKALRSPELAGICTPFVIGDRPALERALAVCGSPLNVRQITAPEEAPSAPRDTIPLLALSQLPESDIRYGRPTAASGEAVYRYICSAARFCLEGRAAAMATAPISKEAMNRAGHDYPGHTELLAELCGSDDFVMMLAGDVLRVSLVTIHEALADIPRLITFEQVLKTIRITAAGVARLTGTTDPRLAVLALNPHCGEGGMFGGEEREIIAPAIQAARAEGIDAVGPLPADTLFHFILKNHAESNLAAEAGGEEGATQVYEPIHREAPDDSNELVRSKSAPLYDGVVAMYHDQGLIPLKMLHFDDGVNITLGLPIIRTSVDHGTAYDLAGTGRASEKSMLAAIRMAVQMVKVP